MRANGSGDNDTKTHATLANGTEIGRYKIIERIGAGGMGEVYLAEDTDLGRRVAMKFLSLKDVSDDESRSRFRREAQAAAVLSHPNIVTIHEVGEHKSRPYIVMEYVKGRSLRDVISKGGLPLQVVIRLAIRICKGLVGAHAAKVIHRDIKPSNIVIDSTGEPKLLDFGLAVLQGGEEITKAGWAVGTIGYMSPEQIEGEKADHRSDIFSLGVVLYQMLTGQHPFSKGSQGATFQAILNESPQPIKQFRSDIPGGLQPIINRALEKDRDKRYQRVDDLLSDLEQLRSILQGEVSGTTTVSVLRTPSVAVMAFSNLSADPEQEYFCDGISEEIINTLAHVEGLRVVARTSSFAFKGKNEDIREIGRRLNVESLLEGSVRKSGSRLRITAQLINVSDGYHLWSERFDRDAEDIFKIQDEISRVIVDKLKVKLFGEDKVRIVKRPMADIAAYELYLKGRYFWSQRTEDSFQKSIDCFLKVLERDPANALAHAGIADCYNMFAFLDILPPAEAFPRARKAAEKALEIDENLAEAHTSLAHVMQYFDWNWIEAERSYQKAIELNPNYATAHQWYAETHVCHGRFDEAVEESRRSVKLDPLSPIVTTNYAGILLLARRYDEAIEEYLKVLDMDPDFVYARYFLSWAYALRSEFEPALAEIDRAIELAGGGTPGMLASRGHILARSGSIDQAREQLRDILHLSTKAYVSADNVALIYSSLGQIDEAFAWMERAYQERNHWLVFLKVAPQYDEFRKDPRFIRLLSKMNLD